MVLILSTSSDNAFYLYHALSKYLIGFQSYGPGQLMDEWTENQIPLSRHA